MRMNVHFTSPVCRACTLLIGLLAALTLPDAAQADPLQVASGKITLPITGLTIELPADKRKGATWALAGSWSLGKDGTSFDGRDVIDLKIDGKIVAGVWVHIGYFDAGGCEAVVKALTVPDLWTAERDLWGQHWNIAGGTWDFANDLGKAPAIAMCASRPGRASLLLYHFFVGEPTTREKASLLAALDKDRLLERVTEAWTKDRTGEHQPTKRAEIKRRGDVPAVRKVHLENSGLDVMLPDDGFVWLLRHAAKDAGSDYLDRMAPSLPDVSLELGYASGRHCEELFPTSGPDAPQRKSEPPPKNVPTGWKSLGTIVVEGAPERLVCHETGSAAMVVGLLLTPPNSALAQDFSAIAPLLNAVAAASDPKPKTPEATPKAPEPKAGR